MITVNLKGGIGNQLYQIAAAYSLAKDNNTEFFINAAYKGWTAMQGKNPDTYKDSLFKNFKYKQSKPEFNYTEKEFRYNKIPFIDHTFSIEGYFQSYLYFKEHLEDLRKLFTFYDNKTKLDLSVKVQNRLDKFREEGKHVVGVHTRGGDYKLNPDIFPLPDEKYYKKAMSKFDFDNTVFLYCTDDKSTLNQFKFNKNNIHVNGDEMLELCLLSHCDSLIMANSSFSAWASYLIKEKYSVYCPKVWFGKSVDTTDLFDPSWIKL
jgi:hypothetical protein